MVMATGDGGDDRQLQHAHWLYVGAFIDELARSGTRHIVFTPGSRSTPLVVMADAHPQLKLWSQIDERAAAFFALGLAKAVGEPAALICTSGSAAANFFPAVAEACHGRVPLIVLTADRPHELRDVGAPQAMNQMNLYGPHAKWFVEMAPSSADDGLMRYSRTMAARAAATAVAAPAGPVHLNFPFREPLLPLPPAAGSASASAWVAASGQPSGPLAGPGAPTPPAPATPPISPTPAAPPGPTAVTAFARSDGSPYITVDEGRRTVAADTLYALAVELAPITDGLIICGPQDDPGLAPAISRLARALGWPVLADPLSQVRCGPHDRQLIIDTYDAFLRDEEFAAAHRPTVVLRFGAMPTSKPVLLYLHRHDGCRQIVIDEGGWREPTGLASRLIQADPTAFGTALADALTSRRGGVQPQTAALSDWIRSWLAANHTARAAIAEHVLGDQARAGMPAAAGADDTGAGAAAGAVDAAAIGVGLAANFEGRVFLELAALLPADTRLFVGSSMPVRDLDTFFPAGPRPVHFMANRGLNGIDGVVSTALGVSAGLGGYGAVGAGVDATVASARANPSPLVLVIGDLSFYHDMNGLLAAKLHHLSATIILINNDGGGIFSFLPQAAAAEVDFEGLFGTPTGLDYRPAVEMYGGRFIPAPTWSAFQAGVRVGLATPGLTVVEVRTSRTDNVAQHQALWQAVSRALARRLLP